MEGHGATVAPDAACGAAGALGAACDAVAPGAAFEGGHSTNAVW